MTTPAGSAAKYAVKNITDALNELSTEVKNSGIVDRIGEVVIEVFRRIADFFKSIVMPGSTYYSNLIADHITLMQTHRDVAEALINELNGESPNEDTVRNEISKIANMFNSVGLDAPIEAEEESVVDSTLASNQGSGSQAEMTAQAQSKQGIFARFTSKKAPVSKDVVQELKGKITVFEESVSRLDQGIKNLEAIKGLYSMYVSLFTRKVERFAAFKEMPDQLESMVAQKYYNLNYPKQKTDDPVGYGARLYFQENDRKQQRLAIEGVIIDLIENPFIPTDA